jgi:hypothetical protein
MIFSESSSFPENLDSFLLNLRESDPELATILTETMNLLIGTFDEPTRRAARNRFHDAVLEKLQLVPIEPEQGS